MILAIETSTAEASLALFDCATGEVSWEKSFTSDRAHNAAIFEPLAKCLEMAGAAGGESDSESGIEVIVVGTGPGSYSGVRVGIAVANGASLAIGAACFGLPSLIALPVGEDDYRVIGDARRGEFFTIEVRGRRLQGEAELLSAELLEDRLDSEQGPVFTVEAAVAERFSVAKLSLPTASELARHAAQIDADERADLIAQPLEPIYLRAPHITMPKDKPLGD